MLKILGIAGSLRKGSYNKGAIRAAAQNLPPDTEMDIFKLNGIPVFNQDIESPLPEAVKEFKGKIVAADAILIATPEYNNSMSGVIKNAVDWGSRPMGDNSWDGKPVAIMSASPGRLGGVRAQIALRQAFVFLNMHDLKQPEVIISGAMKLFDENGNLTDEDTRKRIRQLVEALVQWTSRFHQELRPAA